MTSDGRTHPQSPAVMRAACLVPARGGSRRFPHKNIALLAGRPLLACTVETVAASRLFPHVWVSTDDPEIAAVARAAGARVHARPEHLATDTATVVQTTLAFLDWLASQGEAPDVIAVVLPTAALVQPADLQAAVALLGERDADFVMAVTRYLESPFQALVEDAGYLRPCFAEEVTRRSQTLPPPWVDSGAFYLARVVALRAEQTFYGKRLVGAPIPRDRSIDIDTPEHLAIAEALLEVARRHVDAEKAR